MSAKSPAASAATAMLFATGAAADLAFLSIHSALGPWAFLLFALLAAAAGLHVAVAVPETKGRTLQEVQQLLAPGGGGGGSSGANLSGKGSGVELAAGVMAGQQDHVSLLPWPTLDSLPRGEELLPRRGYGRSWPVGWRTWRLYGRG